MPGPSRRQTTKEAEDAKAYIYTHSGSAHAADLQAAARHDLFM